MSGMYMSEWPMFGTKDPNLGSSTDLLFDRDFIFGAFATCLIQGGYPVGATFERTGDVVTTGGTFGPNEPITLGGKYYHHGQITETIPAYGISPIVRPTAPDVYDTAAAAPNPDKHGLNWEFSDPKNGWVRDLLDGRAEGSDLTPVKGDWSTDKSTTTIDNVYTFLETASTAILTKNNALDPIKRYETLTRLVINSGTARINLTPSGVGGTSFTSSCECIVRGYNNSGLLGYSAIGSFDGSIEPVHWKEISPATGTLNLKGLSVVPAVTEWQTTGDFNILSGATGNQIVYIEIATGLICATDGTNTTKSVQPYVAVQDHTVSLAFGDSKMQIYLDGVNGTQVPFVGTFTPGETLKWGLNNEDIFSISSVCGQTTSSFSESVHLAEELAYDL